jgi:hypothetical protein
VFSASLRVTPFFGLAAQLGHVSDRDTTVPAITERLSFSGEACHFINDGLFSLHETQGLLKKMCCRVLANLHLHSALPNTLMFSELFSDSFQNHSSSGTAICVGCLSIGHTQSE